MITRDLKISKLLDEYPDSLEVLLKVSPHFRKLENKLLRKALAGRVTVEQAASIAGVDLNFLLSELNKVSGDNIGNKTDNNEPDVKDESGSLLKKKPVYLSSLSSDKIRAFDVRPILDSGNDPLKNILSQAKGLKSGEVLLIINSFEPVPLYTLLEEKGFSHWTENEGNLWRVYFYKVKESQSTEADLPTSTWEINIKDFEKVIEVDVHDLPAPEPMIRILESLNKIDEKSVMLVFHHREPNLLYPKLEERGYMAMCTKLDEEKYQILIAKKKGK